MATSRYVSDVYKSQKMSAQYIYVARYDLAVGHKLVLLFKVGDCFIPIPSCSNNPNWAVCVDMKGNIGYVPYTYVDNKQVFSKINIIVLNVYHLDIICIFYLYFIYFIKKDSNILFIL